MNYNNWIKFYKGYVLEKIYLKLQNLKKEGLIDFDIDKDQLDLILKINSGIDPSISCKDMDHLQLDNLCINSFIFGDKIGVYLNYPNNEFLTEID